MDDQIQELESFRAPKRKSAVWPVVIVIAVMAAFSGVGYYFLNQKYMNETEDLNGQISALTKQAEDLVASSGSASGDLSGLSDEPLDPNLTTKTYENTKYGYALDYPKSYSLVDYLYDSTTKTKVKQGECVIIDKNSIPANTYYDNADYPQPYLQLVALDQVSGLSSVKSSASGEKVVDVKVAGQSGWKYSLTKPSDLDGSYSTTMFFNHGNTGFMISFRNSDAKGTHDKEIDDIISSITFNN